MVVTVIWVDIGKQKKKRIGMGFLIYLARTVIFLLAPERSKVSIGPACSKLATSFFLLFISLFFRGNWRDLTSKPTRKAERDMLLSVVFSSETREIRLPRPLEYVKGCYDSILRLNHIQHLLRLYYPTIGSILWHSNVTYQKLRCLC